MLVDPEWASTIARSDLAAMPVRLLEKRVRVSVCVCLQLGTTVATRLEACCVVVVVYLVQSLMRVTQPVSFGIVAN
jgi:hypothetical protein